MAAAIMAKSVPMRYSCICSTRVYSSRSVFPVKIATRRCATGDREAERMRKGADYHNDELLSSSGVCQGATERLNKAPDSMAKNYSDVETDIRGKMGQWQGEGETDSNAEKPHQTSGDSGEPRQEMSSGDSDRAEPYVKETGRVVSDKATDAATDVAVKAETGASDAAQDLRDAGDKARSNVSAAGERIRDNVGGAGEEMGQDLKEAKDWLGKGLSDAGKNIKDVLGGVKHKGEEVRDQVSDE